MSKRRRKRAAVQRGERVKPPPEAAQHARAWPMQDLLALGPEADGIDSDEFEAGIEVVETFKTLTADVQAHGTLGADLRGISSGRQRAREMSDRAAFMISIWFHWAWQIGPIATQLVEQIEDQQPIRSVVILRHGLRRWLKIRHDLRQRPLDRGPAEVLTMREEPDVRGDRGYALPITDPSSPIRQGSSRAGTQAQAAARSAATKR